MLTDKIFRMPAEEPLTNEKLMDFITQHQTIVQRQYLKLWNAYDGKYDIEDFKIYAPKPYWKPDNRIPCNFARYIVDTFEGFFIGVPIKISSDDEDVEEYVNEYDDYNDEDDLNAELSTLVSIFGRAYEIYFVDEYGELSTAVISPLNGFMIYDDSIRTKPLYFVHTVYEEGIGGLHLVKGSISDAVNVVYFDVTTGNIKWEEEKPHGYDGVPATEYIQNATRKGLFEDVLPLINAYNKVLSEKADDVEYFSDSYMKIIGAKVDAETTRFIRDNRIINLVGDDAQNVEIDFIGKPDADTSQEHLLERLEQNIFTLAMVCNINRDDFATTSGIALKYKMLSMINLAKRKERQFTKGLKRRYEMLCSNVICPLNPDDYLELRYKFTLNIPQNVAEEVVIATQLAGVTSKQTQLEQLSFIDSAADEIDRMREEETDGYSTNRYGEDTDKEG